MSYDVLPVSAPRYFEVFEENAQAVDLFVLCQTQWRVVMGGYVGLDYPALFRLMEMYDIKDFKDTFERVRIMESAALKVLNRKAA